MWELEFSNYLSTLNPAFRRFLVTGLTHLNNHPEPSTPYKGGEAAQGVCCSPSNWLAKSWMLLLERCPDGRKIGKNQQMSNFRTNDSFLD